MATRILIVEDEAIVAMDIARRLERRGCEITGVVDAAEAAIDAAREQRPDLVLMDIRLRGARDGIEAAREIGAGMGIPVIFLTAHADAATVERAKSVHPYGYLLKPFDDAELHTAVEMALNQRRREHASANEAAEVLRQSEERFRLLVKSLPDYAVFLLDRDGRIQSCNPAAEVIYGHAAATLLTLPFSFLHPLAASEAGRPREMLARAAVAGSFHGEDWQRRKSDGDFWADILVTALHDSARVLIGFAAVVRDMTERKRAEEAIKQLNTTLERRVIERTRELALLNTELEAFTYSVAHDLRAPLRGIIGYLEALREDHTTELPAPAQVFLERGMSCANRMQDLVDDLLKLSRIGRQELHRVATPLNPIASAVIEELSVETAARHVDWQVGDLPTLVCDPGLIRQVFVNLLSNAVKYTRPRPRAIISIRQETFELQPAIVVSDNGVGFDMRHSGSLFTPFFRMHSAKEFEGTGIGLATTERIIRRHGGRIWAEAEVGKGARFYFTVGNEPR